MALALTDEQVQITDAMAGFAARHGGLELTRSQFDELATGRRPGFWGALADQGLHAVHLPERIGGQGGGLAEAACVIDAAGYGLLPGPLLPTVIAGAVAATAEPGTATERLLDDIVAGRTAALILPQAGRLHASSSDGGWSLSGSVGPELGLCGAERILVSAGEGFWVVLDTGAAGVQVVPQTPTDLTRDVGVLRVDGVRIGADDVLTGLDEVRARCIAVSLLAAEAAGIARWCVDNVVAYLKVREQFGRPIGSFQALQHKAATLFINSELAAASAWDAVRAANQSTSQHHIAAAGAAIVAVGRLPELVVDALTMFGAIGYTWEHDLH
ncbi:MAG: acyl-CoA dehydrogenase family protein, partial [Mycobacterium sp.]